MHLCAACWTNLVQNVYFSTYITLHCITSSTLQAIIYNLSKFLAKIQMQKSTTPWSTTIYYFHMDSAELYCEYYDHHCKMDYLR